MHGCSSRAVHASQTEAERQPVGQGGSQAGRQAQLASPSHCATGTAGKAAARAYKLPWLQSTEAKEEARAYESS